ncbi:MAG: hypothetical protein KC656_14370, partial [Myxococcales bacterium]|nr:hypothetical protein [Myxococcales bacterium]
VTVQLGQPVDVLQQLYPTLGSVPPPYDLPTQPGGKVYLQPTLDGMIELFTTSPLVADQFTGITVASNSAAGTVSITATGCNLADYATQLPAFLAAGVTGLNGWKACTADGGACAGKTVAHPCTNDPSQTCVPWVFFLPLGQPLVNHEGVMLLNYPPDDALCAADYQNNFTMNRWRQVLAWAVDPPVLWANIVDIHPIAASGSNESSGIDAAGPYFTDYWQQMLRVVADPPNLATRSAYKGLATLPVMPSGGPSHQAWSVFIEQPVSTGDMGKLDGKLTGGRTTAWVATNHPDVASYNCCPGDTSEACCDGTWTGTTCEPNSSGYQWSWDLHPDEVSDFTGACYFENTSANPTAPLGDFALTCARGILWGEATICVQGRQDYTFQEATAHCNCKEAAEAFCASNGFSLCPSETSLTPCSAENAQFCPTQTNSWVTCAGD